jgi:diguanylate cyclase (GGDEF)-like protein
MAQLQVAYDSEKKDKTLLELHVQQKEQKYIRYGLTAIVFVLFLLGLLLTRINRSRTKANRILEEKNQQINTQHSELQKLNKKLERQSLQDKLTGLKNRRYFAQHIKDNKAENPLNYLVIMVDLDYFKAINDNYGHSFGDEVLQTFAKILQACSQENDTTLRWGGEEFLWLCPNTSITQGIERCNKLNTKFAQQAMVINQQSIHVTCSLGFSILPPWKHLNLNWEDAIKLADMALYRAKDGGRNRCFGYQPTNTSMPSDKFFKHNGFEDCIKDGYLTEINS